MQIKIKVSKSVPVFYEMVYTKLLFCTILYNTDTDTNPKNNKIKNMTDFHNFAWGKHNFAWGEDTKTRNIQVK